LVVASRPLGAHVSFDGQPVGDTPMTLTDVAPGEHRIDVTVNENAYEPWSSAVVVTAGQQDKLLAVMIPNGQGR
jgi:hypothetical protein